MENTVYAAIDNELHEAQNSELEGKYLTFYLDKQLFGIPIADVVQIISIQDIISLPDAPFYVKGIINLRGNIIPIVDARIRLGKEETVLDDHSCIIVTSIRDKLVGFLVDGVDEVTAIADEQISPPPQLANGMSNALLTGIGKQENRVILLMKTQKLLNDSDFDVFENAMHV